MRPCLGVVLAGLVARAGVGVGGLEEAIESLEDAHTRGYTSFRFALEDGQILAQVEQGESGWRTVVELVS